LITLSVAKGSNNIPVVKQLRRECNTASNIKDNNTRKKVLKALNKLIVEVSQTLVEDGYLMFAAYDGV
jgi:peptide subunit release factor 1 (eRF1)